MKTGTIKTMWGWVDRMGILLEYEILQNAGAKLKQKTEQGNM